MGGRWLLDLLEVAVDGFLGPAPLVAAAAGVLVVALLWLWLWLASATRTNNRCTTKFETACRLKAENCPAMWPQTN